MWKEIHATCLNIISAVTIQMCKKTFLQGSLEKKKTTNKHILDLPAPITGPSSLGAKWFRYRVSIHHPPTWSCWNMLFIFFCFLLANKTSALFASRRKSTKKTTSWSNTSPFTKRSSEIKRGFTYTKDLSEYPFRKKVQSCFEDGTVFPIQLKRRFLGILFVRATTVNGY